MKRYAVKVINKWKEDVEGIGAWDELSNEQIVAICDSKDKAKELILEAIRNVAEIFEDRGFHTSSIESLNDGWRYRIELYSTENICLEDNEFISCCEEFEEGVLGEIEV